MLVSAKKTAGFVLAGGALFAGLVPAASAGTTNNRFNAVGSDTIFCADNSVAKTFNTAQARTTGDQIFNTPPLLSTPIGCEVTPATYSIPADSVHGAIAYSASNPPPNGSSAGISALVADNGAGNIAYARSSRGRTATDPSNIDFWAFAIDGVTWAGYTGGNAPANLTAAQLTAIYSSSNGTTCNVTDWSQVGGKPGAIQRFFPQPGSGTGKFFATLFLGGTYPSTTGACPVTYVQENDGTQVPAASQPNAIVPYSYAVYTAQGNSKSGEVNLHGGAVLKQVNGVAPTSRTISESAAFTNIAGDACTGVPVKGVFCGSRYVYHVTDQLLGTNHPTYQNAILAQVGVKASNTGTPTTGFCANKYSKTISLFGFKPLTKKTTAQTGVSDPVSGTSFCRQF